MTGHRFFYTARESYKAASFEAAIFSLLNPLSSFPLDKPRILGRGESSKTKFFVTYFLNKHYSLTFKT